MKYNLAKSMALPLSEFEKSVEEALPEARPVRRSKEVAAVKEAAARTLKELRGGRRAGAGRKPRAHVRTTLLLAPEVREKLEALAARHGSMSLAAEAAIRRSPAV